ncbi:MAG: restriction endonuclease subunit S [Phycisphaera sp.]|nr:restriction endonuclease subunit S [Phycisphaera sp.]
MPDKPPRVRLSDLCEQITDCPHSTPVWTNAGVIVIRNQNIRNGRLDLSTPSYTDEQHFEQRSRRARLRAGDLILTREAPMGEVCMVPQDLRCCLGQRMVMLRADPRKCHSRFLLYAIQSEEVQHEIRVNEGTGSTVSNLRIPLLEALPIPCPPLPEQRAIASVLGALDDKIDLNRRMCQTLEEMARALFKSWFVDFDPVRAKMESRDPGLPKEIADLFPSRLVDSELGPIPEGWTASNFGCIAEARREGVAANQIDAATKYIGLEHMPRRSISLWEWESGDAIESNKSRFAKGDILFGKLRPYFHKVGVAPIDGVCSTDIIVIQPKNRAAFSAVLGLASSDDFVAYTDKRSAGTRMPRTNWSDMAAYPVAVPPSAVLSAHDSIIRPLAERIASAIHEVRLLQALRDTLLPKLIAGEVRVPASLGSMQEMAS